LEEVYSFDRERVAELAHKGAGLAELTDAILMDMACSLERFLTSEQIEKMTVSGDGTLENVGIKVDGKFQCQHCSQKFDSKQQRQIHHRFVHPPQEQQVGGSPLEDEPEALLKQAVVCARRKDRRSMARAVRAADVESDMEKKTRTWTATQKRRLSKGNECDVVTGELIGRQGSSLPHAL